LFGPRGTLTACDIVQPLGNARCSTGIITGVHIVTRAPSVCVAECFNQRAPSGSEENGSLVNRVYGTLVQMSLHFPARQTTFHVKTASRNCKYKCITELSGYTGTCCAFLPIVYSTTLLTPTSAPRSRQSLPDPSILEYLCHAPVQ
jgi:hypothetical protein